MYIDGDLPAITETPLVSNLLITHHDYPILSLKWETKIRWQSGPQLPQSSTISTGLCECFSPNKENDSYSGNNVLEWDPTKRLAFSSMSFGLKSCREQDWRLHFWEQGEKKWHVNGGREMFTLEVFRSSGPQGAWNCKPQVPTSTHSWKKRCIRDRPAYFSSFERQKNVRTPPYFSPFPDLDQSR